LPQEKAADRNCGGLRYLLSFAERRHQKSISAPPAHFSLDPAAALIDTPPGDFAGTWIMIAPETGSSSR